MTCCICGAQRKFNTKLPSCDDCYPIVKKAVERYHQKKLSYHRSGGLVAHVLKTKSRARLDAVQLFVDEYGSKYSYRYRRWKREEKRLDLGEKTIIKRCLDVIKLHCEEPGVCSLSIGALKERFPHDAVEIAMRLADVTFTGEYYGLPTP